MIDILGRILFSNGIVFGFLSIAFFIDRFLFNRQVNLPIKILYNILGICCVFILSETPVLYSINNHLFTFTLLPIIVINTFVSLRDSWLFFIGSYILFMIHSYHESILTDSLLFFIWASGNYLQCFLIGKKLHHKFKLNPDRKSLGYDVFIWSSIYFFCVVLWFYLMMYLNSKVIPPMNISLIWLIVVVVGLFSFSSFSVVSIIQYIMIQDKMKMEVERAKKLQLVSQLAASVAHEVRNPLTVVRGFLQILQQQTEDEEETRMVETVIQELDNSDQIIREYLNLARNTAGTPTKSLVNITDLIRKEIALLQSYSILQNVNLSIQSKEASLVNGYENKLRQLVLNVLKNTITFVNGKYSKIEISVGYNNEDVIIMIYPEKKRINITNLSIYKNRENAKTININDLISPISEDILKAHNGRHQLILGDASEFQLLIYIPKLFY